MPNQKPNLVIYHKNCADGFCAAWVYYKKYGDSSTDFVPAQYGEPIAVDFKDKNVFILDFSYSKESLLLMKKDCKSLIVLDHHVTEQKELQDLNFCIFDMSRSGAMLTWNYFYPGIEPPELVKYVQDRDLWKWELRDSKEVSAAIASYPFNFEVWNQLDSGSILKLSNEGQAILRYQQQLVDRAVAAHYMIRMEHQGTTYDVPCVNSPQLQSEIGSALAKDNPFAVIWFYDHLTNRYIVSLRSNDKVDVSAIAKAYGGGGHKNAAGFKTNNLDLLNLVRDK